MRTSIVATLVAAGLLSAQTASGQIFQRRGAQQPTRPQSGTTTAPTTSAPAGPGSPIFGGGSKLGAAGTNTAANATNAPRDNMVVPANRALPEPDLNALNATPGIALPDAPIEPFLLTKDAGPFMVMAHTFRGPNAAKYAQILAMELRDRFNLPAYVLLGKEFPGKSNLANIPPTAPEFVRQGQVAAPENARMTDEAAVLVGNEKSLDDSEALLKKVKKLKPDCLDKIPQVWNFRKGKGLSKAMLTTNPYVPAEQLYQRKPDVLLMQMNEGPHSVFRCPGNYSLQIAEFTGRSAFVTSDKKFLGFSGKGTPLKDAADNAEKLAAALAKDKEVQQTGYQPYVYHDRFSSKVMIGSFSAPTDPNAVKLRNHLIKIATDLNNRGTTETMIVPATQLTNVSQLKPR